MTIIRSANRDGTGFSQSNSYDYIYVATGSARCHLQHGHSNERLKIRSFTGVYVGFLYQWYSS